jgi:hypothetical protein
MLQELLTYAADVIALTGLIGLPLHAIITSHINEVKSWGTPHATPEEAPAPALTVEPMPQVGIEVPAVDSVPQPEIEQPVIDDPWELPIATGSRRWATRQPVKPVLALCPAKETFKASVSTATTVSAQINLKKLDLAALRKLCTQYGINWKNVRGKGKHLTKAAMISQLEQTIAAA